MSGLAVALLALGCLAVVALALEVAVLRRRLELVAQADHELRGPAGAIGLAAATMGREPGGARHAAVLEAQLDRMRAGLADLTAARRGARAAPRERPLDLDSALREAALGWTPVAHAGGRGLKVRWDGKPATVTADRGRLAQALGNLVSNAIEHGSGPVELRGRSEAGRAILEVADAGPGARVTPGSRRKPAPDRGRGLGIAARAVEEAGGQVRLEHRRGETRAVVELPLREP